jgi:hypothetical protein
MEPVTSVDRSGLDAAPLASHGVASQGARASATFHVDLLGILFMVWGMLTILIGASTLALGIAAAALTRSSRQAGAGQLAAGITAAAFFALAVIALVWGFAHLFVGARLRRRLHWVRMGAIVLGTIDLLLLPYGTTLGAYALWVLLREDAKRLF